MIWRVLFLLLASLGVAHAQQAAQNPIVVTTCGQATVTSKTSPPTVDQTGNICVSGPADPPYTGNGSIALTTASVLLNTLTANAASGAFPATITYLELINVGSTDAAICPNLNSAGATCTCPGNAVLNTNGITLKAGGGGYTLPFTGLVANKPSIVGCSGTPTVQVRW